MADERLRDLERRARHGDQAAATELRRARQRAGTYLPAVHFAPEDCHEFVNSEGKFDKKLMIPKAPWYILAPCKAELWPRNSPTFRKVCRYTTDPVDVTCKTCLRSLNAPKVRKVLRRHYAPGSAGGRPAQPVCKKSNPHKYREEFLHTMKDVNCPICCRIMQKGKRRSRAPGAAQPSTIIDELVDEIEVRQSIRDDFRALGLIKDN